MLEGALAPNDRLLAVEHLHEGDLIAPEAFAEGVRVWVYTVGTAIFLLLCEAIAALGGGSFMERMSCVQHFVVRCG